MFNVNSLLYLKLKPFQIVMSILKIVNYFFFTLFCFCLVGWLIFVFFCFVMFPRYSYILRMFFHVFFRNSSANTFYREETILSHILLSLGTQFTVLMHGKTLPTHADNPTNRQSTLQARMWKRMLRLESWISPAITKKACLMEFCLITDTNQY